MELRHSTWEDWAQVYLRIKDFWIPWVARLFARPCSLDLRQICCNWQLNQPSLVFRWANSWMSLCWMESKEVCRNLLYTASRSIAVRTRYCSSGQIFVLVTQWHFRTGMKFSSCSISWRDLSSQDFCSSLRLLRIWRTSFCMISVVETQGAGCVTVTDFDCFILFI